MVETEERLATKERHERYRLAAASIGSVRDKVSVNEDADKTGAYVEVIVWIPKAAIE